VEDAVNLLASGFTVPAIVAPEGDGAVNDPLHPTTVRTSAKAAAIGIRLVNRMTSGHSSPSSGALLRELIELHTQWVYPGCRILEVFHMCELRCSDSPGLGLVARNDY
jgi:hypothetical protein